MSPRACSPAARSGRRRLRRGAARDARARLALAAFVGDGHTETALGREGASEDVARAAAAQAAGVGAAGSRPPATAAGPRWPAGSTAAGRAAACSEALGDRLRWVEAERPVDEGTAAAVAAVGAKSIVRRESPAAYPGYPL